MLCKLPGCLGAGEPSVGLSCVNSCRPGVVGSESSQGDKRMGYEQGSGTQRWLLNTETPWLAEAVLELKVVGS